MNKESLYQYTKHAIEKHHFSYRDVAKKVKCHHSYIYQVYHSKPLPKLKAESPCILCAKMLKDLSTGKLDKCI